MTAADEAAASAVNDDDSTFVFAAATFAAMACPWGERGERVRG
jgi:hypothetical protein